MKEKFKYLFKNVSVLFIGTFSSRILVFLMVPLYTRVLSTEEYGSYDLLYVTIQMIAPILSLNISEAVMRFTVGSKTKNKKAYMTVGIKYIFFAIIVFIVVVTAMTKIFEIDVLNQYYIEFIVLFVGYLLQGAVTQFAKGIEDIHGIAISGVLSTACMLGFNVLFLLVFKWGLTGYFYANASAWMIASLFLIIKDKIYRFISFKRNFFHINKNEKEMIAYSAPLILNTLSWQINNISDRYMVTFFCGLAVNGLYSVAYKIPSILNAFQSIFIQAWQLSSIKERGKEKIDEFYTIVYKGTRLIMIVLCSTIIMATRLLARVLFANDFYNAWRYVPILLIYIVFNTLSGTVGAVFGAEKDSKTLAYSAVFGAGINIVLNFVFIYYFAAEGAAIATTASSIAIWIIRTIKSRKYIKMKINYITECSMYCMLMLQAVIMTVFEGYISYIAQAVIWMVLIIINYFEIRRCIK